MPIEFSDVKGKIVLPAKKKETRKGFMMSAVIDFGTPRNPDHWYINFYPQDGTGFGEAEVKIIGASGVPIAFIFEPLVIIKEATSDPLNEPLIVVPACIVMVLLPTI